MLKDSFFSVLPTPIPTTPLYGLRPLGDGTGDVESLFSYFLRLAHEHRLSPKKVIGVCLPPVAASLPALAGWKFGWAWESKAGKDLVGPGQVSRRWSSLLGEATGQSDLEMATLFPLSLHVAGDLSTNEDRLCLRCMASDVDSGALPYGRLLWRMRAVSCCPIHRCRLVTPVCGRSTSKRTRHISKVMLSGVCKQCGSVGHRCSKDRIEEATDLEVWRAEQCRDVIAALPRISLTDPRAAARALRAHCAEPGSQTSLSLRSGLPPSTLSRWFKSQDARMTFDGLLDLAVADGLQLAALLCGQIEIGHQPVGYGSAKRAKRTMRRVDHSVVRQELAKALTNGESVTLVAQRLRVDVATLARHRDLYVQVRQSTIERRYAAKQARQDDVIAHAEAVAIRLIGTRKRLSRRNALPFLERALPSETSAAVLALMRIGLGDRTTRYPLIATRMGDDFLKKIEQAVQRVRLAAGDTQMKLSFAYQ